MGKNTLFLLSALALTLVFQACSNTKPLFYAELKSQTNGDGYRGKPTPYEFRNPDQPCLEKGANGKPLPSSQIFIFPEGGAQLVREQCADITPRPLSPQDYSINANGDITYQNQVFAMNLNQGPFEVVAASCPTGKTMLANPTRTSLAPDSLNLLDPGWDNQGVVITPEGSLASLPVYRMERQDPNALENWHRLSQNTQLKGGESYVYSFFVKTDSTEKVRFISYFPSVHSLIMQFDLINGSATVEPTTGVTLLETKATPFSGGLYINIYFTPLSDVQANIGVTSLGEFVGTSISATAIQLEKISNFCSP